MSAPEVEIRTGRIVKVTFSRDIAAQCRVCSATFNNTGAAASHARAQRHQVDIGYSTSFAFVPAESEAWRHAVER